MVRAAPDGDGHVDRGGLLLGLGDAVSEDALQRAVDQIGGVLIDLNDPDVMSAIDAWLGREDRPPAEPELPCGGYWRMGPRIMECGRYPGHLSAHGPAKVSTA